MTNGSQYIRYTINKNDNIAKVKISKRQQDIPQNYKSKVKGLSLMDIEELIKDQLDFSRVHKRKNKWIFCKK